MAPGASVAAAIPIEDGADDGNTDDDDDIKILIDKDNDNDNDNNAVAIADVDAQGNVRVDAFNPANATSGSGFGPFILLDLDDSVVTDIKGLTHRKYLNRLQ